MCLLEALKEWNWRECCLHAVTILNQCQITAVCLVTQHGTKPQNSIQVASTAKLSLLLVKWRNIQCCTGSQKITSATCYSEGGFYSHGLSETWSFRRIMCLKGKVPQGNTVRDSRDLLGKYTISQCRRRASCFCRRHNVQWFILRFVFVLFSLNST